MDKKIFLGITFLMSSSMIGCTQKEYKESIVHNQQQDTGSQNETNSDDTSDLSYNLEYANSIYKKGETPLVIDGILVVNKTFDLPKNYTSGLNPSVLNAFKRMQSDAEKEGVILNIRSGFRSNQDQENLFNNYVKRDGLEKASRYSAKPGHSEHETGLAIDITDEYNDKSIGDWFNETKQAKWLYENAYKYGFILRYPEGKEDITGYKYESWHYRYVGTKHSKSFAMNNLTLEEYLKIVD